MVSRYNQEFTPRAFGGAGVPDSEFVKQPPQEAPVQAPQYQPSQFTPPPAPAISPEEAQRRLLAWAGESGQVLDPTSGNVVARQPVQAAPYGTNPGVIRRPEPMAVGYPMQGTYGPVQVPAYVPQAPQPRMSLTPMSVQSIQSIDFERNVVWADGTPFSFDPREAQPVLQFALEVILRQFASQFGALLQRYGFAGPAVQSVPVAPPNSGVPTGQQQTFGLPQLLPVVPRQDAASVPESGTVPVQVPVADAAGTTDGAGDSAPTP